MATIYDHKKKYNNNKTPANHHYATTQHQPPYYFFYKLLYYLKFRSFQNVATPYTPPISRSFVVWINLRGQYSSCVPSLISFINISHNIIAYSWFIISRFGFDVFRSYRIAMNDKISPPLSHSLSHWVINREIVCWM